MSALATGTKATLKNLSDMFNGVKVEVVEYIEEGEGHSYRVKLLQRPNGGAAYQIGCEIDVYRYNLEPQQ